MSISELDPTTFEKRFRSHRYPCNDPRTAWEIAEDVERHRKRIQAVLTAAHAARACPCGGRFYKQSRSPLLRCHRCAAKKAWDVSMEVDSDE